VSPPLMVGSRELATVVAEDESMLGEWPGGWSEDVLGVDVVTGGRWVSAGTPGMVLCVMLFVTMVGAEADEVEGGLTTVALYTWSGIPQRTDSVNGRGRRPRCRSSGVPSASLVTCRGGIQGSAQTPYTGSSRIRCNLISHEKVHSASAADASLRRAAPPCGQHTTPHAHKQGRVLSQRVSRGSSVASCIASRDG
jgi:hypothetical protein